MTNMLDALKALCDEDDGQSVRDYFLREERARERMSSRGRVLLANIERVLKWEESYEDMLYSRGVLGYSNLMASMLECLDVTDEEDQECPFPHEVRRYSGDAEYKFLIVYGQGCVIRVYKDDKLIFHST